MKIVNRVKAWRDIKPPGKILAIRFQALGDVVITLPYLQNIRQQFPDMTIHFLTRKEVSAIPKSIGLFDKVFEIGGGRNVKLQLILLLLKCPLLIFHRYDAVLDLQNNVLSILLRRLLRARAWAEFDKHSPMSAAERTRQTIESLWSWRIVAEKLQTQPSAQAEILLRDHGYREGNSLVVLNPAGYCESRNWPIQSYIELALAWLRQVNSKTQFVLLLTEHHRAKSNAIKEALGSSCVDLTGRANQTEAFAILGKCNFVLTEDSGLMHMAWVQDVPTLALFSSSRKDWSAPQGERSFCMDSSDMECGPCLLDVCKFNDNRCLTRYSSGVIIRHARDLLKI